MASRFSNQGLVVDVNYLYQAKELLGGNLDYNAVVREANRLGPGQVIMSKAHIRNGLGQRKFVSALRGIGFDIHSHASDAGTRNWVADIAESIMAVAPHVDHLIAGTGDGRLSPILEFAHINWNCAISVIGFRDSTDQDIFELLEDIGGKFIDLDESFLYSASSVARVGS